MIKKQRIEDNLYAYVYKVIIKNVRLHSKWIVTTK